MRAIIYPANGFAILNGGLLSLYSFWPIIVTVPFVFASLLLMTRGHAGRANVIALIPATAYLFLWVIAVSQPFGFGG